MTTSPEAKIELKKIKVYADGAILEDMKKLLATGFVTGFTTNPSLMRKVGTNDYLAHGKTLAQAFPDHPLSLEVLADTLPEMERQAHILREVGKNVYVKIPAINTKGETTGPLIKKLSDAGIKLNITAIMTTGQVMDLIPCVNVNTPTVFSLFAGRIADVGRDPMPMMYAARQMLDAKSNQWELLWASCREVWNIFEAERCGCDIITAPTDVIKKLKDIGKASFDVSLEAVRIFADDAKASGFSF